MNASAIKRIITILLLTTSRLVSQCDSVWNEMLWANSPTTASLLFGGYCYSGNIQDTTISHIEGHKYNYILFNILAQNCGKTFEEMIESSRRDKWFNSHEALQFGLIDEVIGDNSMDKMLVGFDDYYNREVLSK